MAACRSRCCSKDEFRLTDDVARSGIRRIYVRLQRWEKASTPIRTSARDGTPIQVVVFGDAYEIRAMQ